MVVEESCPDVCIVIVVRQVGEEAVLTVVMYGDQTGTQGHAAAHGVSMQPRPTRTAAISQDVAIVPVQGPSPRAMRP